MKRADYILMYTKSLLMLPREESNSLLEDFGVRFELNEPGKPGAVSIGARQRDGSTQDFHSWIRGLRTKNIRQIVFAQPAPDDPGLPPHIAAAFAGSPEGLMAIHTETGSVVYSLHSFFSSYYAMDTTAFVQLIRAQQAHAFLWIRIAEHVQEFNAMNQRANFDGQDVAEYLMTPDGQAAFETLASQLLTEVQVECLLAGTPFIIPEPLQHLFYKSDMESGFEDEQENPVFLYPLTDVTAEELLTLVDHQTLSPDDLWSEVSEGMVAYEDIHLPDLKPSEWPGYILGRNADELTSISSVVCRSICVLCEETDTQRVLPASLTDLFGPDEAEHARAVLRSKLGKDQWLLTANEQSWELNLFIPVEEAISIPATDYAAFKKTFAAALTSITAFARDIDSPFQEAFGLGLYLLNGQKPAGVFDDAHLLLLKADAAAQGFSERALEHLEDAFYYGGDAKKMHWPDERCFGLIAASLSDVFGGMGSWNDQYIEQEEDVIHYQNISATAFQALNDYMTAVLSA